MAEAHHAQPPHDRPAGVDVAPQQRHDHQVQRVVAQAQLRQTTSAASRPMASSRIGGIPLDGPQPR